MTIKKYVIKKDSGNFTVFPNNVLQNLKNYDALGLYVYIASLPHGWQFYKHQLATHGNIGRDKINKLLKVLEVHGLVKMVQIRTSKGRFEHFELEVKDGSSFKINDLENQVQPFTEKPLTENQLLVNSSYKRNNKKAYIKNKENIFCSSSDEPHIDDDKSLKINDLNKAYQTVQPVGQNCRTAETANGSNGSNGSNDSNKIEPQTEFSLFDYFWNIYPRKQKKKDAEKIWKKNKYEQIATLIFDNVKERIKNEWATKEKEFIPLPSTYLNGERWNDEIINGSMTNNRPHNGLTVSEAIRFALN